MNTRDLATALSRVAHALFADISNAAASLLRLDDRYREATITEYAPLRVSRIILAALPVHVLLAIATPVHPLFRIIIFALFPVTGVLVAVAEAELMKRSLKSKIEMELPFVTMYMAALIGSGAGLGDVVRQLAGQEATEIFPATSRIFRMILMDVEFLNMSLPRAVMLWAKKCPSPELSSILLGLLAGYGYGGGGS